MRAIPPLLTRNCLRDTAQRLDRQPFDSKGAIRDIFEAAETLTKLLTRSGANLTEGFVDREIRPILQKVFDADPPARGVANKLASSLADWVQAAHPYRHGHGTEEPVAPPDDLTILIVSQGLSFVRWLSDLDRRARAVAQQQA